MFNGSSLVTFSIREPYQGTLRQVRHTVAQQGLHAPVELDVALRIKQELGAAWRHARFCMWTIPRCCWKGLFFAAAPRSGSHNPWDIGEPSTYGGVRSRREITPGAKPPERNGRKVL